MCCIEGGGGGLIILMRRVTFIPANRFHTVFPRHFVQFRPSDEFRRTPFHASVRRRGPQGIEGNGGKRFMGPHARSAHPHLPVLGDDAEIEDLAVFFISLSFFKRVVQFLNDRLILHGDRFIACVEADARP